MKIVTLQGRNLAAKRKPSLQFTVGGLMVGVALLAVVFAYPWLLLALILLQLLLLTLAYFTLVTLLLYGTFAFVRKYSGTLWHRLKSKTF